MKENSKSGQCDDDVAFGANEVRLSPLQCLIAGLVLAGLFWIIPVLWNAIEPFTPSPDHRIPPSLNSDYWMYNRYSERVASGDRTLLIGDSVVWGHYVKHTETLSHYLNQLADSNHFANMGINGIHPVALAGLVNDYGRPIKGKNVILHCNLLWLSSKRHDLQIEKEFTFNHPELAPQFFPRIPCYRESASGRLGNVILRKVPFFGWVRHMRIAYYGSKSLPEWTIKHPYANPAGSVTLHLPPAQERPSPLPDARPWTERQLATFNPNWVELSNSLQWHSFQRTLKTLQRRGNRVFVWVGPLNEHMLTDTALRDYNGIRSDVEHWLRTNNVPYYAPSALPSENYADTSHPLAAGYAQLAKELLAALSLTWGSSDA